MSGPPLGRPVALVTGAGGGLGGGIARALSAKGFALLLNDLAESSALTDLCAELRSAGAGVDVVVQDIAHVEELAAFVERATPSMGGSIASSTTPVCPCSRAATFSTSRPRASIAASP